MLVREIRFPLSAMAHPASVVLWVQTGCGACHHFHGRAFAPVATRLYNEARQGAAPAVQFFVIDAAHPISSDEADDAGIEQTPSLTFYRDGEAVEGGPWTPDQGTPEELYAKLREVFG